MPAKLLMVQGTASTVGKSIVVTALCRVLCQDGFRVAPFKAQNMALNSFVTLDGGEIGRAQAVQAQAAGIEPTVEMNPVLLKPEAEGRSQVIVRGKVTTTLGAGEYYGYTRRLWPAITASLDALRSRYDIVVIEGAGSPAEINLRRREIVNMRVAREFNAPVLLVGDVDRGGVFGALVGTLSLLTRRDRELVRGLLINKFRGDIGLLMPGLKTLEKRCRKPVLGVIPYLRDLKIAQEDSVYLDERPSRGPTAGGPDIAVIRLPHISNYDDFDPLEAAGCRVRYVSEPGELAGADLIILPGSKNTIGDLGFIRSRGLDGAILNGLRSGTPVVGVCGGFQMLGNVIRDREGVESDGIAVRGLGLLDVDTSFGHRKRTVRVRARVVSRGGLLKGLEGCEIEGYEIHMGKTVRQGSPQAFSIVGTPPGTQEYADGAVDESGTVVGTYIHGLFHNAQFCRGFIGKCADFPGKGRACLSTRMENMIGLHPRSGKPSTCARSTE